MTEPAAASWAAYHLYYHEDLNRAVTGFALPSLVSLLRDGRIDGFFFVRYGLGGPHIRLRLRVLPGCAEQVAGTVRKTAERFLAEAPSTKPLEEEAIRRSTAALLANDPHETDDKVYPDNTLLTLPFLPETRRYGGPELLPSSLDFFTVSSSVALDFLSRYGGEARSRQLILCFRLLLRQALSFAMDEEELLALASYGVESWGKTLPTILAKGDRVFEEQQDTFGRLWRDELTFSPGSDAAGLLGEAALRLSRVIGFGDRATRQRIGISQLHMTATRLGLSNVEEVYVSRLLANATRQVLEQEPGAFARLEDTRSGTEGGKGLCDLLPRAFAVLQEGSP